MVSSARGLSCFARCRLQLDVRRLRGSDGCKRRASSFEDSVVLAKGPCHREETPWRNDDKDNNRVALGIVAFQSSNSGLLDQFHWSEDHFHPLVLSSAILLLAFSPDFSGDSVGGPGLLVDHDRIAADHVTGTVLPGTCPPLPTGTIACGIFAVCEA